jgi:hypothetical protein
MDGHGRAAGEEDQQAVQHPLFADGRPTTVFYHLLLLFIMRVESILVIFLE